MSDDYFVTVLLIGFALYFFPTIVAACRRLKDDNAILILNIFLGWTVLGWVGALCWAVAGSAPKRK